MAAPQFQLREVVPEDAPALREIAARTFVATFGSVFAPERLEEYIVDVYDVNKVRSEIDDDKNYTMILFREDKPELPCGYATLQSGSVRPGDPSPQDDCLEVKRFYVDKEFHGSGCAYIMMDHLMHVIRQKQPKFAWLIVWGDNMRAARFYNKFGFVQTGQQPSKLGSGYDLVMTLQQ